MSVLHVFPLGCPSFPPGCPPGLGILSYDLSIFDCSIFSIFQKYRPWSNRSRRSLKKINYGRIDLSFTKNDRFEKTNVFFCFWQFPPFYAKRSNRSRRSSIFFKTCFLRFAFVDLWSQKVIASIVKPRIEFPTLLSSRVSSWCFLWAVLQAVL